jgi:uncharacterized membrane protein YhaH (DUF805 family)
MPLGLAHAVLAALAVYLAAGAAFGLVFIVFGIARIDHGARGAPWTFRLLVLPGVIAFWPWMALLWRRAGSAP